MSRDILRIFRAAIQAADPRAAVERLLKGDRDTLIVGGKRYRLGGNRKVFVIGAGKAGAAMAQAVERRLGARIQAGFVNVKYGGAARLRHIELNECGHPVPDRSGERGATRIAQIASDARREDLVICLVSGGASALLPLPAPPVTLREKQETTRLLLSCGADIHEMNCVRKHLSRVKGGQLARLASPAAVLTLILSDVVGDDLDVIGSGPTAPDSSTFAQARSILAKYGIWKKVPATVRQRLESSAPETPKPGDPVFSRVRNLIVGSNRSAVDAAARQARALGYRALVLSTVIEGETREAARVHAAIAREIRATGRPVKPPACVLSGGETTVTIHGRGLGGRNQEFALAAAIDIAGLEGVTIASIGTDGSDGPTDAAGAVADGSTIDRASRLGISAQAFLADNDSYHFFERAGGLIKTGPTGTNVADLRILLVR